ncbi:hypothetical protein PG991_008933 [Apiospora marii]|uniref:MADS-box domain-containing protein n=1 Tax=Apiospora marii TaxID=335849 RepID=A0ABR1RKK5_9PEZI
MVRRSRPNKNRARGIANTRRGIFKKANTGHKYYGYEVAAVIRANGRLEGWTDNPHEATDSATDQSSPKRSTTSISDMPSSLDDLLALDFTSTPSVRSSVTAKSSPLSTSPALAGQSFAPETPMPFLLGEPESNPPESRPGPSENYIYPSSLIRRDSEQDKTPAAAIYGFNSPQKTSARSPVLISSVKRQSLLALAHDIFGDD